MMWVILVNLAFLGALSIFPFFPLLVGLLILLVILRSTISAVFFALFLDGYFGPAHVGLVEIPFLVTILILSTYVVWRGLQSRLMPNAL